MNNKKIHSLIYVRVSSIKQEKEGFGLESQEARCRQFSNNEGFVYDRTFRDSFTGGGDFMNRPAMRELLDYVDNNPQRNFAVIFDDLKRFARDVQFHFALKKQFKDRGVELRCLNYNFDDTPEGEFVEMIMAGTAELERKQNKRQVVQKMKSHLEQGRWVMGGNKIGYARAFDPVRGGKNMIFNNHAPFVKEALEGFACFKFNRKIDVARFLKEKGVFGNAPVEKYLDTTKSLISDIFYAGFIEYPKWEVSRRKGIHEALISEEIFNQNQKRLKNENLGMRIKRVPNPDFVLGGLVVCSECGKNLKYYWAGGRSKKYPYYECKEKDCSMRGKVIKRKEIEDSFNLNIKKLTAKEGLIEVAMAMLDDIWVREEKDFVKKRNNKIQKMATIKEEIIKLTEKLLSIENGSVLEKQLLKILEEKANLLEGIQKEIDSCGNQKKSYRTALMRVFGILKHPLKTWVDASIKQKQNLFRFFFKEKLAYSAESGYRTAELSSGLKFFEKIKSENSHDVEMGGIEPPCI